MRWISEVPSKMVKIVDYQAVLAGQRPVDARDTSTDPAQLADNLTCLDVSLPADTLARLDQASRIDRGFPHDFLASNDFIFGGMSGQLDLPPGRSAHG